MEINELCAKYSRPLFERVWFVFAFLACTIVPFALNSIIFNAITPKALRDAFDRDTGISDGPPSNRFDGQTVGQIDQYVFDTRMIVLGILLGMLIVLWTPFVIWKRIGSMRARALTARWLAEDRSSRSSFVPRWVIKTPGVFSINGVVTITTPPNTAPTLFARNAYLPPYILQADNPAAEMAWAQQVPYNPSGPQTGVPPEENDEKHAQQFDDVKV